MDFNSGYSIERVIMETLVCKESHGKFIKNAVYDVFKETTPGGEEIHMVNLIGKPTILDISKFESCTLDRLDLYLDQPILNTLEEEAEKFGVSTEHFIIHLLNGFIDKRTSSE